MSAAPWASSCTSTDAGVAKVRIVAPADGGTVCGEPFSVALTLEHFDLVDAEADPYAEPDGTGHVHIYLNGQLAAQETREAFDLVEAVPDGLYEVTAELANLNHSPVEPEATDTVTVTVSATSCGDP